MGYVKKGLIHTNINVIEKCQISVKEKFGYIPKSVNKFMKIKEIDNIIRDKDCPGRNVGDVGKAKRRGGGRASHMNYSLFNSGMADFIVRYFFKENDNILDPFMGKATRPMITNLNKMNYIGFDVDTAAIKYVKKQINQEKFHLNKNYAINIINEDGVALKPFKDKDNIFDGIFTCPPYWNVEKYSGEGNDLSYCKKFDDYLKNIEILMENCYRLIKPSDFKNDDFHLAVFVVGSFREGKKGLIDLDYHFQRLAYKAGFVLHDKVIHENIPQTLVFSVRRNYVKKITTKSHETILVFRKEKKKEEKNDTRTI